MFSAPDFNVSVHQQLSEGLHFLHDSVKMLHRNLGPESIILNHQGAWKIFGFDFCVANCAPANQGLRKIDR